MQSHSKRRTGESLRRIEEGLGFAEKLFLKDVWWPAFNDFEGLHPEYQISDYKDGYRYIDFAYIHPHLRIAIEIQGFLPHWRNIDQWKFDDECLRQAHLTIDGWYFIPVSFNQVKERSRTLQQLFQQLLGRYLHHAAALSELTVYEREVVRMAARQTQPLQPLDVCRYVHIGDDFAHRLLHGLTEKNWLTVTSGAKRIRSYTIHPSRLSLRQ